MESTNSNTISQANHTLCTVELKLVRTAGCGLQPCSHNGGNAYAEENGRRRKEET